MFLEEIEYMLFCEDFGFDSESLVYTEHGILSGQVYKDVTDNYIVKDISLDVVLKIGSGKYAVEVGNIDGVLVNGSDEFFMADLRDTLINEYDKTIENEERSA